MSGSTELSTKTTPSKGSSKRQLQGNLDNQSQYLTFALGSTDDSYSMMLPTADLVEILTLPFAQITPIPDTANFVMGVCNWRGEVMWVLDLSFKLGFEPLYRQGYSQTSCSVILLQSQGMVIGLAVKKVGQMLWSDRNKILPSPPSMANSQLATYLQGYWLSATGETFLVLESNALVQDLA
jgi:positive phototaxis protein PixI